MSFLPELELASGAEDRAILVHVDLPYDQPSLDELKALVESAGAQSAAEVCAKRAAPDAGSFIGRGKLEEIRDLLALTGAGVVIFNHELSPSQERNVERELACRVVDRNRLILDIFAQRARSFEGKLQVELAQLRYLSTRLIRGWTHLERQRGGIGMRGPGESQLETDRRLIAVRIKQIRKRLARINQQRQLGRNARQRASVPVVALAGYTNAGKSTLFNTLTDAGVFSADQLFATLDTTLRRVDITASQALVLADTVGFLKALPHDLIAAFRATLQETRDADLLLHVIDAAASDRDQTIDDVDLTLEEIGADRGPRLMVYNKIDMVGAEPRLTRDDDGRPREVWVSAKTGAGLDLLRQAVLEWLDLDMLRTSLLVPAEAARARARLYESGGVLSEEFDDAGGSRLEIEMPRRKFEQIARDEPRLTVQSLN